ncbi:MAG: integrase core domain-containing protein, partial [Sphingopyxis granuli]|uniref:integrase core domain-containing protein n=1 Tax=Sphingopyxis granuli TaxID=267128 RepID=UPI003C723670
QLLFRDLLAGHDCLDEAGGRYAPLSPSRHRGPSKGCFPMCYGIQFTNRVRDKYAFHHIFDRVCDEHGIEHRLTKVKHPWTNGQVERMNRTIKEATVKRYHYDSHAQLTAHLHDFINAYNYGRRLKTLRGLTPYEYICKCWTSEPQRFTLNPHHQMPGQNT